MTWIHPSEWDALAAEDEQDRCEGTGPYATKPPRPVRPDAYLDPGEWDESPCTGVGCAECGSGCDRDYGDD